jgi:hydrogenase small subunit
MMPTSQYLADPEIEDATVYSALRNRGVSRRRFLEFCSIMAATLALPDSYITRVADALETKARPVMVWLEFQDCAGNSESMLRSPHPDIAAFVLDLVSLNYHEVLMAGSGKFAEKALSDSISQYKGKYIVVVEGAIPKGDGGVYCTIGGRTALSIVQDVCKDAAAVIAVGACAWDGGLVAASPNPTGATGLQAVLPGTTVVNLGGCPHNPANTAAVLTHYITFGELPALDQHNRPLFAYGRLIHDQCERRAHYDAGEFVEEWDDAGSRKGFCLYKMGCKGPESTFNCPTVRWNNATSWPVKAGHGCIGCATYRFWDTRSPFYQRLPSVPGFGVDVPIGEIGLALVGGVAVASAVHGVARAVHFRNHPGDHDASVAPAPGTPPNGKPIPDEKES